MASGPAAVTQTGELQKVVNKLTRWVGEQWRQRPPIPREYMEYRQWDNVVMAYTKCNLTEEQDKLIAISGLAESFRTKTKDEYLAGLWRRVLPYQLLWRVKQPHLTSRPQRYVAPSWSWAAVKGAVKDTFYYKQDDPDEDDICVNMLNASVSTSSGDGLGDVTSGYINLRGQLVRGLLKQSQELQVESGLSNQSEAQKIRGPEPYLYLKDGKTGLLDKAPTFDVISESSDLSQVFCLLIRHRTLQTYTTGGTFRYELEEREEEDPHLKGLILIPTNNGMRDFRRIGIFRPFGDGILEKKVFDKACTAFNKQEKGHGWDVEKVKMKSHYAIRMV
jgi:hypothetical protein